MIRNKMTKLFADYELKRQKMEEVDANDRYVQERGAEREELGCMFFQKTREREEKEELVEKAKKEKEWKQEWDVSVLMSSVLILPNFNFFFNLAPVSV